MHPFIISLQQALQPLADTKRASGAKAYLRDQFDFIGIPTPLRRSTFKQYMKDNGLPHYDELETIVKQLWQLPEREFQYCAIELMMAYKKSWHEQIITLFEYCIVNKSWWDTVDFICGECVSPYFKKFPAQLKPVANRWNNSENIWLQRSSLLAQKGFKKDTDTHLLSRYIIHLSQSKEFFVQKAIGWMLREYARVDGEWVRSFVASNKLAPLSKREAMKHL